MPRSDRASGPIARRGRRQVGRWREYTRYSPSSSRSCSAGGVRAGIAQARRKDRPHGRPRMASLMDEEVVRLKAERVSHVEIARRLRIGRTSVRRILAAR